MSALTPGGLVLILGGIDFSADRGQNSLYPPGNQHQEGGDVK